MRFKNRTDAGNQLAQKLKINRPNQTIIVALPRGGVPLGLEISTIHHIPFDVVLAKKIVHPLQSEFAIGAIAEDGFPIINETLNVDREWIEEDTNRVRLELKRRRKQYDKFLTQRPLSKKDVIIVDDGIATGMTMFAAIEAVKNQIPNRIIVAVPIIPKDTNRILESRVDEVIAIEVPSQFRGAVGAYYQDFSQVSDAEVEEMIRNHEWKEKAIIL